MLTRGGQESREGAILQNEKIEWKVCTCVMERYQIVYY